MSVLYLFFKLKTAVSSTSFEFQEKVLFKKACVGIFRWMLNT